MSRPTPAGGDGIPPPDTPAYFPTGSGAADPADLYGADKAAGPAESGDPSAALVRPFVGLVGPMAGPEPEAVPGSAIRPFLVTAGRTAGVSDLPIEAQVVVTAAGRDARQWLTFEYRDIVSLCDEPLALAEIAARLSLHLGVARVLVGDLEQHGIVSTYRPEADFDVDTIQRVIHGLRLRG
ncbi:MAG TPA: DUF742 domain-containing protein [Kineosporiaceae bacterium]|nr:DUF742 domain-containing protein [Kineosporiaceae bacterium]